MPREDDDLYTQDTQPAADTDDIMEMADDVDGMDGVQTAVEDDWSLIGVLDKLEVVLSDSRHIPVLNLDVVDVKTCFKLLQAVRQALPEEVRQARIVVSEHQRMMREASEARSKAQRDAQKMLDDAHYRAESEYVRRQNEAEEYARRVMDSANAEATQKRDETERNCSDMIRDAEERVEAMLRQEEIYRRAEDQAYQIVAQAKQEAGDIYQSARTAALDLYADLDGFLDNVRRAARGKSSAISQPEEY